MNKPSAQEWLKKSWHNLSGAELFYNANHYSDVTAVEIHYATEKILKSIQAYHNQKILKSHNLVEIYSHIDTFFKLSEDDLNQCDIISEYHIEESYPQYDRPLPSKTEIKKSLEFTKSLFYIVCKHLQIDSEELKSYQ